MSTTSDAVEGTKSWSRTKSVKYHLEHTWSIEDFTVLHLKPTDESATDLVETDKKYPCIESAPFSPTGNDQLQFYIQIYPCGNKEENKDIVGIFLHLLKSNKKEVNVQYSLAILNANGQVLSSKCSANRTFTENSVLGWTLMKHVVFRNKDNDLLPGDVLTIQCKVDVIYEQTIESRPEIITERMQQLTCEYANQLTADLLDLSSDKTSDVILLVSGKEFTVHKLILSARSTVFKAMFESDCKESKEGKVEITDVDLEVFEEFLRFLYTGKVTLGENAFELLEIADKYATESLKTLCEEYFSSKLTIETVVAILVKADMHSAVELKAKAIQFIVSNLATIVQMENWDAALEARSMLALEVVRQIGKTLKSPNASEAK